MMCYNYDLGLYVPSQGHMPRSNGKFISRVKLPHPPTDLCHLAHVYYSKTMCTLNDLDLYIQGQRPRSNGKFVSGEYLLHPMSDFHYTWHKYPP